MVEVSAILEQGGLERVTPSTWLNLRQCAWRVLLARYYQNKPLLPPHPDALLGSILHHALEKITKGELRTKESFDQWWETAVNKAEEEFIIKGWGQFVPLKENTRHFGLKKIQARNRLTQSKSVQTLANGGFSKATEQKIASPDGLLVGQLDCIIWREGKAEIRDYKTGTITESEEGETTKVKEGYRLQMKLYACLFHGQYGRFPSRLVVEDLNGTEHEISFNEDECWKLREEVSSTLAEVNQKIVDGDWEALANPGEHCANCQNRPACKKYLRLLKTTPLPTKPGRLDLRGTLLVGEENACGSWVLKIEKGGIIYSINGPNVTNMPEISQIINQEIAIFNLRTAGAQGFTYSKFSYTYAI